MEDIRTLLEKHPERRLADTALTIGDLRTMLDLLLEERERGKALLGQDQTQVVRDVLAAMRRNRWTPPPGARSSLEFLREDRDR